jgi:multicomponent Na+:H+ antiporter subunit G
VELLVTEVVGYGLLILGTAFCALGVFGVIRLPDVYSRIHAAGLVITMGAGAIFLSLLFLAPTQAGLKALATAAFLLLTAPMVTHVLSRSAHRLGIPLASESVRDDLTEDLSAPSPRE